MKKGKCPLCGQDSECLVVCPECENEGCSERCHPGGNNCLCPSCEENQE